MAEKDETTSVQIVTGRIIRRLDGLRSSSSGKAILATIRKSAGKALSESVDLWPFLFQEIPEEMLGWSAKASDEERAILTALQLYALHQQGKSESVNLNSEEWVNFGGSLRSLRKGEDNQAIDRRFNTMITATTFDEFSYYLRQLIQLLKAKTETKVDYPLLANDIYWWLRGQDGNVRLQWGRSYYRYQSKDEKEEEKKEK